MRKIKSKSQEWTEKQRERLAPNDILKETFDVLPVVEQERIVEAKMRKVRNMEVEER